MTAKFWRANRFRWPWQSKWLWPFKAEPAATATEPATCKYNKYKYQPESKYEMKYKRRIWQIRVIVIASVSATYAWAYAAWKKYDWGQLASIANFGAPTTFSLFSVVSVCSFCRSFCINYALERAKVFLVFLRLPNDGAMTSLESKHISRRRYNKYFLPLSQWVFSRRVGFKSLNRELIPVWDDAFPDLPQRQNFHSTHSLDDGHIAEITAPEINRENEHVRR